MPAHTPLSTNTLHMEKESNEQAILIQSRSVYGQGTVETIARIDADSGAAFLEQRSRDGSTIIAITTGEAAQNLSLFFAEAAKLLTPAGSKPMTSRKHH